MSKSYTIQWKSMENGRTGMGTKRFDLSEAEDLAEELNREYPDIQHEVVKVDASADTGSAAPKESDELRGGVSEDTHSSHEPEQQFALR